MKIVKIALIAAVLVLIVGCCPSKPAPEPFMVAPADMSAPVNHKTYKHHADKFGKVYRHKDVAK